MGTPGAGEERGVGQPVGERPDQESGGDVMIRGPMSLVLRESVAGPPARGAHHEGR
jgi:hypothetical protein